MVQLFVPYSTLSFANSIPAELIPVLSPNQFAELQQIQNDSSAYANSFACVCEILICFFVTPFIFCCHPCFAGALKESKMRE